MAQASRKPEVDERMVKFLVGTIAIALPVVVSVVATSGELPSISAAYWAQSGPWPRTFFIGLLFAISGLLLSYDGRTKWERAAAKVACVAAPLIALYPCNCRGNEEIIKGVHYAAAFVMYMAMAFFCWKFRVRALDKDWAQAKVRVWIYTFCGFALLLAIGFLAANIAAGDKLFPEWKNFVFFWEAVGLAAFGFSWLNASHALPFLNIEEEEFFPVRVWRNRPPVDATPAGDMDGG